MVYAEHILVALFAIGIIMSFIDIKSDVMMIISLVFLSLIYLLWAFGWPQLEIDYKDRIQKHLSVLTPKVFWLSMCWSALAILVGLDVLSFISFSDLAIGFAGGGAIGALFMIVLIALLSRKISIIYSLLHRGFPFIVLVLVYFIFLYA